MSCNVPMFIIKCLLKINFQLCYLGVEGNIRTVVRRIETVVWNVAWTRRLSYELQLSAITFSCLTLRGMHTHACAHMHTDIFFNVLCIVALLKPTTVGHLQCKAAALGHVSGIL